MKLSNILIFIISIISSFNISAIEQVSICDWSFDSNGPQKIKTKINIIIDIDSDTEGGYAYEFEALNQEAPFMYAEFPIKDAYFDENEHTIEYYIDEDSSYKKSIKYISKENSLKLSSIETSIELQNEIILRKSVNTYIENNEDSFITYDIKKISVNENKSKQIAIKCLLSK